MENLRQVRSPPGPAKLGPVASSAAARVSSTDDRAEVAFGPPGLKILHVLRAPIGGLFRHVVDLARAQIARGHRVGLVVDSTTGGSHANAVLADLAPHLALGMMRVETARELSARDIPTLRFVSQQIRLAAPDVLHGHGAKGAAFVRLTPYAPNAIRAYTPHGGSLIYCPGTLRGGFYRKLEWLLNWRTDLFLFESTFVADLFRSTVGRPRGMVRIVRNGIGEAEFEPVTARPDATDIVCVGELRPVKAFDLLLDALALLRQSGRTVTTTIAGDGVDAAKLKAQAERLGIADQVRFVGFRPAREAFAMGRVLVIPSHAESLPYVVLEAAAADVPLVCTAVGGVPEIFGPHADELIPPGNIAALTGAIGAALDDSAKGRSIVRAVRARVHSDFSINTMVEGVLSSYREAIAMRKLAQFK